MNDMPGKGSEEFAHVAFTSLTAASPISQSGQAIGTILSDAGKLETSDTERILQRQKEIGLRFGETAIALGLLTQDDIDKALSSQFNYPYLPAGDGTLDDSLVAAYQPFTAAVEDLRMLRSQLLLRWFDDHPEYPTLAIVSPGNGEGRSYIAANLAILFSQLGKRTLVVDANLRMPRQHDLFRIPNSTGLSEILSGRGGLNAVMKIASMRGLSVLPAGNIPPNPQELLTHADFSLLLHALGKSYDVILLDTPESAGSADACIIARSAKAALLVTCKHASSLIATRKLAGTLQHYGATVVGSVLNQV